MALLGLLLFSVAGHPGAKYGLFICVVLLNADMLVYSLSMAAFAFTGTEII